MNNDDLKNHIEDCFFLLRSFEQTMYPTNFDRINDLCELFGQWTREMNKEEMLCLALSALSPGRIDRTGTLVDCPPPEMYRGLLDAVTGIDWSQLKATPGLCPGLELATAYIWFGDGRSISS